MDKNKYFKGIKMEIHKFIGFDDKERYYTYAKDGQTYIYKQRKKSLEKWVLQLAKRLKKAKFTREEILYIVPYFFYQKGYWINDYFYMPEWQIVQHLCELGIEDIEYV